MGGGSHQGGGSRASDLRRVQDDVRVCVCVGGPEPGPQTSVGRVCVCLTAEDTSGFGWGNLGSDRLSHVWVSAIFLCDEFVRVGLGELRSL